MTFVTRPGNPNWVLAVNAVSSRRTWVRIVAREGATIVALFSSGATLRFDEKTGVGRAEDDVWRVVLEADGVDVCLRKARRAHGLDQPALSNADREYGCIVTHKGRSQTIEAWAIESGIDRATLRRRLARGIRMDRALVPGPQLSDARVAHYKRRANGRRMSTRVVS